MSVCNHVLVFNVSLLLFNFGTCFMLLKRIRICISVSGSSLQLFADRVWTNEREDAGH